MNRGPSVNGCKKQSHARYIAAVNAHPFHDLARLKPCLESVVHAAERFSFDTYGTLKTVLFWHNQRSPDISVIDLCQKFQVELVTYPHVSNGKNLNLQLDFACADGFEFFFRVDADDLVDAHRFNLQAAVFSEGLCDICGGALEYVTESGVKFVTRPPCMPGRRDFIENSFLLHPTLSIRLAEFKRHNIRYRAGRMEDKQLYHDVALADLKVLNIPEVLGAYMISDHTRNRASSKIQSFMLNIRFLFATKSWVWIPYACVLFIAHICIQPQKLRQIRALTQSARYKWQTSPKARSFKPKLRLLGLF